MAPVPSPSPESLPRTSSRSALKSLRNLYTNSSQATVLPKITNFSTQPRTNHDFIEKRKTDENGDVSTAPPSQFTTLSPDDFRKFLQPMSHDHLVEVLENAIIGHPDVLESLHHFTNRDLTLRKLFVRGLGADTTTDSLRFVFSTFGDLDEAIVIFDKATGKSKGHRFVTFKHSDEALIDSSAATPLQVVKLLASNSPAPITRNRRSRI